MLNIEMYTQMGFSENLVKKAHEYSKKNGVDMFDALQQLQHAERNSEKNSKGVPPFSYLRLIKNYKLEDYEVLFGRSVVKNSHLERE